MPDIIIKNNYNDEIFDKLKKKLAKTKHFCSSNFSKSESTVFESIKQLVLCENFLQCAYLLLWEIIIKTHIFRAQNHGMNSLIYAKT